MSRWYSLQRAEAAAGTALDEAILATAVLREFPHLAMSDRPNVGVWHRIAAEYARLAGVEK